jgi:hypothetical protein
MAALSPGKELPVPIGQKAGWAPEPVWTTWRRENSWHYWDSNSDPSVVQPVASRYTDWAIPVLLHRNICVKSNTELHGWYVLQNRNSPHKLITSICCFFRKEWRKGSIQMDNLIQSRTTGVMSYIREKRESQIVYWNCNSNTLSGFDPKSFDREPSSELHQWNLPARKRNTVRHFENKAILETQY